MHGRDFVVLAALGLALLVLAPRAGRAEEPAAGKTSPSNIAPGRPWLRPSVEGPWRLDFAVWGWLPSINIEAKLDHQDTTLPIDLGTIIDDLQWAAFLDLELRKGTFGAYFSPLFVGLRASEHVQGPPPLRRHKVTVNDVAYLADFGLSYEIGRAQLWNRPDWVVPTPVVTIEPIVGARWLIDDIEVEIKTTTALGSTSKRKFTPEISFIAPVVGLRTLWDLTDRLNLRIAGDYGGFDVDDLKQTYNVVGAVGWRFRPKQDVPINVFAGYRYLYVDYEKVAELEVSIQGPFVGLAFEFSHD